MPYSSCVTTPQSGPYGAPQPSPFTVPSQQSPRRGLPPGFVLGLFVGAIVIAFIAGVLLATGVVGRSGVATSDEVIELPDTLGAYRSQSDPSLYKDENGDDNDNTDVFVDRARDQEQLNSDEFGKLYDAAAAFGGYRDNELSAFVTVLVVRTELSPLGPEFSSTPPSRAWPSRSKSSWTSTGRSASSAGPLCPTTAR